MFEFDWFFYAILAALANGLQGFFYKIAVEQENDPYLVAFSGASVSYILAGTVLCVGHPKIGDLRWLVILGTIGGVGFIFVMISRMSALKYLPSSIVFTVFRSNTVIVFALYFILPVLFPERISSKSLIGVLLIIIAVLTLSQEHEKKRNRPNFQLGLGLIVLAAFISAFLYLSQKIAIHILSIDINSFIFVINLEIAIICMAVLGLKKEVPNIMGSLKNGAFIGVYSYASFLFFLHAIKRGNLSLVVAVDSTSFLIPILLSVHFYKEKLTSTKIMAALFTLGGLLLIRGSL
jgi:drug/metabolite transporter (DMT)-like permease